MADIRLKLRNPKTGDAVEHTQTFVPLIKTIEYLESETKLYDDYAGSVPQEEYEKMRVEFVAGLFDDEKVTSEYILHNLDVANRDVIMDIIKTQILGIPNEKKSEKPQKKKA